MIEILSGGRGCGKTQSELVRALEKLEKQNLVNKLLLAKTLNLESENARLKANIDKIRAEIDNINLNEVASKYEDRFYGFQREVIKIIDKYKKEGEQK